MHDGRQHGAGLVGANVLVAGRPVYLATLSGVTDGSGTIAVVSPGQVVVQA